jgi:hypothetical protein
MASTILTGELMGMTRLSVQPAFSRRCGTRAHGGSLASGQGEHADVEYFAGVKGVAFGQDHLDEEQPAAGGHGAMGSWRG